MIEEKADHITGIPLWLLIATLGGILFLIVTATILLSQ